MNIFKYLILLILCIGPSSCGLFKRDCNQAIDIIISDTRNLDGDYIAYTSWECGHDTTIKVLNSWDGDINLKRTIAHELIHAATGKSKHLDDYNCYFYQSMITILPPPCPIELEMMSSVHQTFYITVLTPRLLEPTLWAADFWNLYTGNMMFVVN